MLVHVAPELKPRTKLIATDLGHRRPVMQGREMPGWLRVSADNVATDDDLSPWVEIGIGHARSLPPKKAAGKARK